MTMTSTLGPCPVGPLGERPVQFTGSPDQEARNRASHTWADGHCVYCEAKPAHAAAAYPCGAPVPREVYSAALGRALTPAERDAWWDDLP
jgi:hypothetical protein